MGLTTWIMIAILILFIIGLGWQTFVLGVFKGGEKIINSNLEIKNATENVRQYIVNIIKRASEELITNGTINNQSYSAGIQNDEKERKEKIYRIELFNYYLPRL